MTHIAATTFKVFTIVSGLIANSLCIAAEEKQPADMSDPLAIYNQFGAGATDRGINFKFGQTYDTGSKTTMGMNIIEAKGLVGDSLGWSDSSKRSNSMDSLRFRNFKVDITNGRGKQIDINYNVDREAMDLSYSIMQAVPKWGPVNLYPLAGLGINFQNNAIDRIEHGEAVIDNGISVPGAFGLVGMYGKIAISDNTWLNYNPMYLQTITGSDYYQNNAFGTGKNSVFSHEVIASYQINPVTNIRYFANFSNQVNFKDGQHRVEFNYQF